MQRRRALTGASSALAVVALSACGATTYDETIGTRADPAAVTAPATVTVSADTPLADLLAELRSSMRSLDEQVVDNEGDDDTLARIDELWGVAEDKVYEERPDLLFGFQQAVGLARSGVDRRRPADVSKGYLLLVPLVDRYLAG